MNPLIQIPPGKVPAYLTGGSLDGNTLFVDPADTQPLTYGTTVYHACEYHQGQGRTWRPIQRAKWTFLFRVTSPYTEFIEVTMTSMRWEQASAKAFGMIHATFGITVKNIHKFNLKDYQPL